jgi:hypothetical protein
MTLAVAVIIPLAAIEILLRRHVVPNDSFEVARQVYRTGGALFAAFGDSRVESGVRGSAQLANFGTRSDSLETVLGKAEAWLARNPDGQAIIALPPQQFSSQISPHYLQIFFRKTTLRYKSYSKITDATCWSTRMSSWQTRHSYGVRP